MSKIKDKAILTEKLPIIWLVREMAKQRIHPTPDEPGTICACSQCERILVARDILEHITSPAPS